VISSSSSLTSALQKVVLELEDDLRERVESDTDLRGAWVVEHSRAVQRRRTAAAWVAWRDDRVTQAAVAWVLTSVFVRFCEDNALVNPVWIAGPEHRRQEALDAQLAFFRAHPMETDREWLLQAVQHLAALPATAELVGAHAALHLVSPSGDAVTRLLAFWRQRTEDGRLLYDFTDDSLSTRFLGDLYQDLSAYAKATFALLQTPVFVEEFILDRTLEPALDDRPLEGFKMIDPTCGSGHFLLGAFERLLDRWQKHAPAMEKQALVQQSLDAVHGVDLNPFAVAIARFRLTVAALRACGLSSLEQAPAFRFHLAVGDSLLHGPGQQTLHGDGDLAGFAYSTEDLEVLQTVLTGGRYDAAVGNPPYITVKDKVLNQAYRERYSTCKGTYALTVPFMERLFSLVKPGHDGQPAGWVGQITSNSFMKREFGSKLIEQFLAHRDLRLVVDSAGAYIPGHGTPTVILVGRNQRPVGETVRAVLGVRGEPDRPDDPAKGLVWTSIVEHVDEPGWEDSWVTIVDLGRGMLQAHPWSLSGGGAAQLLGRVDGAASRTVGDVIRGKIGFASFPGADDCFFAPRQALVRDGVPEALQRAVILGETVRDWDITPDEWALVPYDSDAELVPLPPHVAWARRQWRMRTVLRNVTGFGGETQASSGQAWWGWYRWVAERYRTPLTITFAFVATHNHFVLDRGGKVFKQSAPVIKLPANASEDEHLELLGVLNSSTACFWLKQNSQKKAGALMGGGSSGQAWTHIYEFTGTTLQDFPLPMKLPRDRANQLDALAQRLSALAPETTCAGEVPTAALMDAARRDTDLIRARMVAVQEELDWEVYRIYGLVDEDLAYGEQDLPVLALGERAFEVALARQAASGEVDTTWFTHPQQPATPATELPAHWSTAYRELVQRRLNVITGDRSIRLLEKPEHKRRWATEPWEKRQERALRGWLLDRLEDKRFWFDAQGRPSPKSVAQLADEVARDADLVSVLALWEGKRDVPVTESLVRLLEPEAVPYLAAYRYKDSGLRKREAWEQTWALQRREDAGEQVGTIPVPPKYTSADFRKSSYWQARGKLDVPKERFILYPGAGRDTDPTPLLGWAGWDHAQQSLALSLIIGAREAEGWADERLVPLVAGLAELQPWVEQWHSEVDPTYGVSLASFTREQLTQRMTQVGRSLDELAMWRPQPTTRGRKPRLS
jgi:hypothetical protein